jgi:hypothetical protein
VENNLSLLPELAKSRLFFLFPGYASLAAAPFFFINEFAQQKLAIKLFGASKFCLSVFAKIKNQILC